MLYDVGLLWFVILLLAIATLLWGILFLQLRAKLKSAQENRLSEVSSIQYQLQDAMTAQTRLIPNIGRLSQACLQSLDKKPLLDQVIETVWSILSDEQPRVALSLWGLSQDTDTLRLEVCSGCESNLFCQDEFHPTAYPFAQVFQSAQWVFLDNVFTAGGLIDKDTWSKLGLPAEIYIIPIIIENSIQGILTVSATPELKKNIEANPHYYECMWDLVSIALAMAIQGESAILDRLTGVHNREYFLKRFHLEIERATRYQYPLTLLMIDIDNFKQVNDMLGHQRGDAVLKIVAKFLKHGLRSSDLAARYGGDEFIVLLPETGYCGDIPGGTVVAERIRSAVDDEFRGLQKPLNMTVSIGVALRRFPQDRHMDAKELIRLTDEQLLTAKESGKNAVYFEGALVKQIQDEASS